jgi:hypothetical protein
LGLSNSSSSASQSASASTSTSLSLQNTVANKLNINSKNQIEKLTKEKCDVVKSLNYLKQKIQDIEMRQNEAIRDVS